MSERPKDEASRPDQLGVKAWPKLIGARVARVEDPRLLTGGGAFADDRVTPGALHIAFRRSDHAHARILGIETAAAQAMPGVFAVLTAQDLAGLVRPIVATSRMRNYHATPIHLLARDKVRYVGEPVVAILAEDRYLAEDAASMIEIAFQPLDDVVDPERAAASDAPLLHEEAGTNILVAREFARGDVEAVLAEAPVRVGGRFRFHRKTPMALEGRACVAEYDRGRRYLTLTSSTQVPGIVRDALVELLDLPGHSVRVLAQDVGGGFGGKTTLYPEEVLVAALARKFGATVRWTSDRMEDLISTTQAFDEIIDAELGLSEDGRILALSADIIGDVGAYSIYPWTAGIEPVQVASFLPGPYRIDSYRSRTRAVATAKAPMGPYRGVGRPVSTFVMERLIDLAAHRLALDPAALRRLNLVGGDEFPYKVATGLVWDQASFHETLDRACAAIDYEGLRRHQRAARVAGHWFGIGIATYAELTGIGSRISAAPGMPINTGVETAAIRLDATGTITAALGITATGQGLETTLSQVIAASLGARLEDIRIIQGDSAAVAHSTGSYASRSTVIAGGAAILAALAVREKMLRAAAHLLEVSAADLEAEGGSIFVVGTDRAISFRDLARAVYSEMGRLPRDAREELEASRAYDPYFGTTSAATHIATVEIDPDTYQIRVERYVVAEDCGRVVNPLIVEGQVHGGVAQGIGAALYEEVVFDSHGQILTASLADYIVPAAGEIPPIEVVHVETPSPSTLGGFRGMGEGGTIGAPAAVANAVSDALVPFGLEITELPITPERLFHLLAQGRAAQSGGQA